MNRFDMPFHASTLRYSLSKCSGQARVSRSTQHERIFRFPVRPRIKFGAGSEPVEGRVCAELYIYEMSTTHAGGATWRQWFANR